MDAVNNGINSELFDYLQKSIKDTAYYKLLAVELQLLAPGYAEIRVVSGPQHTNPMGLIHGGLITSIADAAMGNAIRSLGIIGVTVDLSAAFTAAARVGDTIVARGKVLQAGKSMIFAEAMVYAGDRLLGNSKATFYKIDDIHLD
jgi:uncharacterized protein (TIGR00369 family)